VTEEAVDTGDEKQVRKRKRVHNWQYERLMESWRGVLSDPKGREVVWDILTLCGLYGSSENMSLNDVFRSEGKRDVGLAILRTMNSAVPHMHTTMQLEAENREKEQKE
jgi:hypothetical protein